jgi:hypothetical protein
MNWGLVIRESITVGLMLGTILTIMIVVSFMINKEMWLNKYPPDVKARWGPISGKAKRQHLVFAILFFGMMIGAMVYDVIRLELVLGTPPSFLAIFASIGIVLALFNLVDAVIIDWLILLVLWPGLSVLPGTEGMPGYNDTRRWTMDLIKGFALAPLSGVLVAGFVFIFFR